VLSGNLLDVQRWKRRLIEYPRYLYFFALERMNRDWSLERLKFEPLTLRSQIRDRSDSIELFLLKEHNPLNEFEQPSEAKAKSVNKIPAKFRAVGCFLCKNKLTPIIQVINFDDEQDYIEYSWCQNCDHSQYSVMPSKQWITEWYATNWDGSGTLNQKLETRKPTYRYYNRLKPFLPRQKRLKVLDIGAGYGEKILPFKMEGHEVFCTEATPRRVQYLKTHVTPHAFLGTFDDPKVQEALIKHGPYDVVFSYHAFEHIYNPASELQLLKTITTEGALIYVAVPEFYKEGILNNVYAMEHIESFSRNSGQYLLKELGFKPIRAKDDLFQYYSDYCQYFVGIKASESEFVQVPTGFPATKLTDYLRLVFRLESIAKMSANQFEFTYFRHLPLRYVVSNETKAKCLNPERHLPIRIYHKDLPLFWMAS